MASIDQGRETADDQEPLRGRMCADCSLRGMIVAILGNTECSVRELQRLLGIGTEKPTPRAENELQ